METPRGRMKRTAAEIQRAAGIARRKGVEVAPLDRSERLLWDEYGGNPFEIPHVIAYYDEDDDWIVCNPNHPAWAGMAGYVAERFADGFYSSRSRDHLIRHEIGHALHYRGMSEADRAEIWYKELTADEKVAAARVSRYARIGRLEFVAEVYAARWAKRKLDPDALTLYAELKGPAR